MTQRFVPMFAALCLAASLSGCTLEEASTSPAPAPTAAPVAAAEATPAAPPSPEAPVAAPPDAPTAGKTGKVEVPPFMAQSPPNAPLTKTPDLDKAIADAEKGKDKKALAAAYAARGTFRMNDSAAGAKIKYKAALDDYRKSLAADPTNAEAKDNKAMIESIYKSMGRPVPN